METLPDKLWRQFTEWRFTILTILITAAGMAFMALCMKYNWPPIHSTSGVLVRYAWYVFNPLYMFYNSLCAHLGRDPFRPILFLLMFSYGWFWALVIELVIKFWPRKRKATG